VSTYTVKQINELKKSSKKSSLFKKAKLRKLLVRPKKRTSKKLKHLRVIEKKNFKLLMPTREQIQNSDLDNLKTLKSIRRNSPLVRKKTKTSQKKIQKQIEIQKTANIINIPKLNQILESIFLTLVNLKKNKKKNI